MNPQPDTTVRNMPPARYAALRRVFTARGTPEDQLDARITQYVKAMATVEVPSNAELRAMQARGELPSDEELARAEKEADHTGTGYVLCDPDGKVVRDLDPDEVTCMEYYCEVTGYQIKVVEHQP